METTCITFNVNSGEETRPVIEDIIFPLEKNESLFAEQYKKVFEEINRFLSLQSDKREEHNEDINNIMAFIGERGSGKTSCMMSVAKSLAEKKYNVFNEYEQIKKCYFHSIGLIDPSFFDETNNILNIIIAKLFRKFKEKEEQCNGKCNDFEKKRELVEIFQRVQAGLNCIIGGKKDSDDDLEQLITFSASVDLRADIRELINAYLSYMYNSDDIMVIMVDDIDLNTQHAHAMVEQIRKYFIHPNIIILLAIKLDQLANVMKRQYVKEFEVLINKEKMAFESIEEMVDRYLGKLIPHAQRLFLPDLETFLESRLIISDKNKDKTEEFYTIREAVPTLIFRKTRYLFYNSQGTTSYIVPRNLRELRHIINLLWNMGTYEKDNASEYNKTLFRKYFYETWVSNNLNIKGRKLIKTLLDITDAVLINKSVISLLKEYFNAILEDSQSELALILQNKNVTYNISVGDVMTIIYYLENITEKTEDQKLLFMIKSIYSIRLYEYYDQITEEQPNKTYQEKEVRKNDYLKDLRNYMKLVGGNFINSASDSLLPLSTGIGKRTQRIINGRLFYWLLNSVFSEASVISIADIGEVPHKVALNLVEFFALTITRLEDPKKPPYRTNQEISYNMPLDNRNNRNLFFDITSFTYNLPFIKKAYDRFDKNLYILCRRNQGSLLNRILAKTTDRYHKDVRYRFMSWVCIRNAEVLQDFVSHLEYNRPSGAESTLEVIKNFFLSAGDFKIYTYDKEDDNDHYTISFPFLKEIALVLQEVNPELFEQLFAGISSPNPGVVSYLPRLRLNIKLNLRGRDYSKSEVWRRLVHRNPSLNDNPEYRTSFDVLFTQETFYRYPTQDVNDLLLQYKSKVEAL